MKTTPPTRPPRRHHRGRAVRWPLAIGLIAAAQGCSVPPAPRPSPPSVAPATQPAIEPLGLGAARITPMYQELRAIDLPTVLKVAGAKNLDVQLARQRVASSRAAYEGAVGAVFPVISPGVAFQHYGGTQQVADGTLVGSTFNNLVPAATVQWVTNPGRVVYDIVAARRRIEATEQLEYAAELETGRAVSVQYYDLVLARARVAVARQAVVGADESLRMTAAKVRAGVGLPADDLRARAYLAARRQDLLLALNAFYQSSVVLTTSLRLDPTITLVPADAEPTQVRLVADDLPVDRLLAIAVEHRPDLRAARTLVSAARADRKAALWTAFGPNLQAVYTLGAIRTRVNDDTTGFHEQDRGTLGAGATVSAANVAQADVASVGVRTAALEAERRLDRVRSQVVSAQQASLTNAGLIPIAREQVDAAAEALRLARANADAGTLLLLDVLQTQDESDDARFRYAQAVAHYNQSQIDLLAAIGISPAVGLAAAGRAASVPPPSTATSRPAR